MKTSLKIVLLVLGLFCLIPIAYIGLAIMGEIYRFFNPYFIQEISGPTTISSEWLEILPEKPLRAKRQINRVVLVISDSYEPDYEHWALRLKDGSLVKLEVQLVDENGTTYDLRSPAIGPREMELGMLDLPKDRVYRMVRIRSDKPIRLSRIYWRCYNQWDVS